MTFQYSISDKLKSIIEKLLKKDKIRAEIIYKKIKEIINCDELTIEHYKNLRYDLSDRKRVHIDKSFVLIFRVDKQNKFILFIDFDHHDNIYKK
ncbi:MAG: addiction module toxin RelE [Candidatus Diapherotrites archaeon CG08_land_8_20_14_0_20_34_12]|nr:MAG: addiction module toxin RelE [Candidatus Diapherotrites archaeon CG08_land_8_20_14_0_20_34_12]